MKSLSIYVIQFRLDLTNTVSGLHLSDLVNSEKLPESNFYLMFRVFLTAKESTQCCQEICLDKYPFSTYLELLFPIGLVDAIILS